MAAAPPSLLDHITCPPSPAPEYVGHASSTDCGNSDKNNSTESDNVVDSEVTEIDAPRGGMIQPSQSDSIVDSEATETDAPQGGRIWRTQSDNVIDLEETVIDAPRGGRIWGSWL